jgi:F-type H+-transporting ATPase subunit epsilon
MATIHVEVVSTERSLLSVDATEIYARTLEGEVGILPNHQPALFALDIGVVRVTTVDGEVEKIAVHHGFLFFRANQLVILADVAEVASQIDAERANRRLQEMEKRREKSQDARVLASIRKQEARLSIA